MAYSVSERSWARTFGMPRAVRYSTAAVRPTASAMGGVPASNFQGTSLGVNPSRRTSRIISPPPRKGGMASSSSGRAHRAPMPVGPEHLVAGAAEEVDVRAPPRRSAGGARAGRRRRGSGRPAAWAASASSAMGLMVPSTFDMADTPSSLAPSRVRVRSDRSSWPSPVSGRYRSSMPRSSLRINQGTILAWCSISVSTTTSPGSGCSTPRIGHQVDGLGHVLGEHHFARGGTDEAGQRRPARPRTGRWPPRRWCTRPGARWRGWSRSSGSWRRSPTTGFCDEEAESR